MWQKPSISLSPKLKLGVGRGTLKNKLFKIGTVVFFLAALTLTVNAGYLLLRGKQDSSPAAQPQVLGATDANVEPTTSDVQPYKNYTVQKGDTLFNISQKINVPWTTLAELNKLKPPFSLKPGQVIKIPSNE